MTRYRFAGLVAALVVALALQSTAHIWETLSQGRIGTELDLDRSNGIPDLLSTAVIVAAALGAVAACVHLRGSLRRRMVALACVLTLVAFADLLHESLDRHTASGALVALTAVAGFVLLADLAIADQVGGRVRATVALGLAALATSIVVGYLPELNEWFERRRGDAVIEWETVVKQGLELAGWWLVAVALWDVVGRRRNGRAARPETTTSPQQRTTWPHG